MNKVLREMVGLNVLRNKLIKQTTPRIHETFYAKYLFPVLFILKTSNVKTRLKI